MTNNRNGDVSALWERSPMLRVATKVLWGIAGAMLLVTPLAKVASAQVPVLPLQVSTNPGNGDQNPYGVAFVPSTFPDYTVQPGDILVSNFNDGANNQGQGTTIINIRPDRTKALFAGGLTRGLTGALAILKAGFVLVGSITVPKPSNFPGATSGPITVLDSNGKVVTTLPPFNSVTNPKGLIDGPWGMAVDDDGATAKLFVSNVLSGTVIRYNLTLSPTFSAGTPVVISVGYGRLNTNTNPLVGPAGLAYDEVHHVLYVNDGTDSIWSIANADTIVKPVSRGTMVFASGFYLHGPLGLALAPNGDLISAQADNFNAQPTHPSEIVEVTKTGVFVSQFSIDAANGAAFGVAIAQNADPLVPLKFAYTNDGENNLDQIYLPTWGLW